MFDMVAFANKLGNDIIRSQAIASSIDCKKCKAVQEAGAGELCQEHSMERVESVGKEELL